MPLNSMGVRMKLQGRIREIVNTVTGLKEWSRYPATREEALVEDVAKYYPSELCPVHGARTVYFTQTGIAACCAHHTAVDAYNDAVLLHGEPITISEAQAQGKSYFWTPQAGPYCGHPGKMNFAGKCVACAEARSNSPRQLAIRAGAAWYTPAENDPCCNGHLAPRRVSNGSCQACEDKSKVHARPAENRPINELVPDMIIDKESAKGLGFKVYRTGKPCGAGHTGWRYISTGGCIDCKNGVPPAAQA